MNISIIIPTYNGENRIGKALEGIKDLIIPEGVICEFLLIDNNSTDNTVEVVNSYNLNFKIIKEEKQGLYYARDRGINESNSNWIFFIDDDIKVQPNWVIEFVKVIENNPMAGLISAPLKFPESYKIDPLFERFKTLFAITDTGLDLAAKYGFLCSMLCVNKECYLWLKENDFKQKFVGRGENGNLYASGEDIEYSLAIKYTPYSHNITFETFATHYFDQKRLTFDYCLKIQKMNGFTFCMLAPLINSDNKKFKKMTSYYYSIIKTIIAYFKKEETKEMDILNKTERFEALKNLLKNKKAYQNYEKEIKNAKWNILNEKN